MDLTLADLKRLRRLNLSLNRITDISALVSNPGLDSGDRMGDDKVYLDDNPLSQDALCKDIPILKERGVRVHFDGECDDENGK